MFLRASGSEEQTESQVWKANSGRTNAAVATAESQPPAQTSYYALSPHHLKDDRVFLFIFLFISVFVYPSLFAIQPPTLCRCYAL